MVPTEISPVKYGKLLARTLPQIIETREEFDRLVQAMEALDRQERLTPKEHALRKLLEHLIKEYDDKIELPDSPPYRTVLYLMERQGYGKPICCQSLAPVASHLTYSREAGNQ